MAPSVGQGTLGTAGLLTNMRGQASRGERSLPRVLSQKTARVLLESEGWTQTLGGKHVVKMEKAGQRPITLPHHHGADYSPALTNAILKQAGLKGPETTEE